MVGYTLRSGVHRGDLRGLAGRTALIVLGLVIGACVGLWVAIETIPLPNETVIYVAR